MSASVTFTTWDELDVARFVRDVNEAFAFSGDQELDQYTVLDPARLRKKIEDNLGVTISEDAMTSPTRFMAEVQVFADGSGSSAPDWVPADAKIFIDLVNDRAWTEADGEVAIDTLLGSDPSTENGWNVSVYDAGNLTADGYGSASDPVTVAFIGAARSMLLDAATFTVKFKDNQSTVTGAEDIALMSADGNDALEIDLNFGGCNNLSAFSWGGSALIDIPNFVNSTGGAINVAAITIDGSRYEAAINGSDAASATIESADRPSGNPLVSAVVAPTADKYIQSITIYDPLPDTTGLSALSQTGVTNTAPTAININWTNAPDGVFASGGGDAEVAQPRGVDAEGNPCVITVVAADMIDGFPIVSVFNNYLAFNNYLSIYSTTAPAATYHFTLRATDPGGLHVEQAFTLTVTA